MNTTANYTKNLTGPLLIDQANTVKESYGYSGYGSVNAALSKTAAGFSNKTNPYRYTGKRSDTGSNTLDMGARRYSAATGRFLQYDLYSGALDNLGLSADPLTQNRYAFAAGNPISFIETDGHKFEDTGGGGAAAAISCDALPTQSFCGPLARGGVGNPNPSGGGGSGPIGTDGGCSSETAHSFSLAALTFGCFWKAITEDREALGKFCGAHELVCGVVGPRGGKRTGVSLHPNSLLSKAANHLYVIWRVGPSGKREVYKYGISSAKLNKTDHRRAPTSR
jgi:RHS repeat-associated protein